MEVEKVLQTPTRPLRANEPFLRNATGRVLPEWKFYTIGIGLLEIDPGKRSENIDAPWRDAEVEPRLGVEGDCDPPTPRYLISEASSAANSSIQSLSPGARSNHLVVKLSQFEDRRDLLLGSSGLPECAIEGPVVFRHPTLAPTIRGERSTLHPIMNCRGACWSAISASAPRDASAKSTPRRTPRRKLSW